MKSGKQSQTPIPAVTKDIPAMDLNYSDYKDDISREPIVEEAEPERGNWTGRFDFLLSLLGYSVGLGNVWRFPYLCYNNGGGAFLIPFTVMLVIAGLPLMFMELSFGQYAALGPVAVYNRFCPLFRGLGYGMVIVSSIVMLYYNLIIAWTIYYMVVSFASIFYQLPWQNCDADWSTKYCYSYEAAERCEAINGTYYLRQCLNQSYAILHNIAALADVTVRKPPAEEYFTNQVLGLSSGIEETGQIRWGMAACLFAAWLIVFLCLCKGVKSSGKVVYFTALFPYVVLVILFFRGVTLPGASTGILFYLTPDFTQLANAQVWGDAAVQIFFALSPAWGGLITLSSYNKFSNNCYIDSLIVAVSNIATSFFAGLVIFSVIGFLAHELEVEVDRVVDQGAGLAFIVYPEVVTRLPVSPLWSILFFVMLLTLGLDSQFALMETVTTAILDRFPRFRHKKTWVVFAVAVFGYLGGLIFTTNSGMYWLQLMDKYAANWSVLIIAIGECILIAWIYGAEKFCIDIQTMIGRQSRLWVIFWSSMWRIITPAALVFILIFNWIEYKPASYGHYVYPMWADAVGWTLGVLPIIVVVLMAVNQICSGPDDLTIMEPESSPALPWSGVQRPRRVRRSYLLRCCCCTAVQCCVSAAHDPSHIHFLLCERVPRSSKNHTFIEELSSDEAQASQQLKTSQDGTDSTSLTSGLDNDLKRPGTSANKIKKASIKRKVPNYSHESDDAIIEPLLQTEKEHSVVANKSAKYLLNKSKTDCLLEKDTKPLENPRASTPVSIPNNITNNSILENQSSPSFISDTAPIYNHMNVNVLSGLDLKKLNFPTGKSIILEIDGCKAVCQDPSPLIFTTAKIHADTKIKVMELLQATPIPKLSSKESDVVKTAINEDDKRHSILHSNKQDISKNVGHKSDFKLEATNLNEVLTMSNSIPIKNQENIKEEIDAQDRFEKSAKIFSKDQKVSLKTSSFNSVDPKLPISQVTFDDTVMTNAKPTIATSTFMANGGFISDSSKQFIGSVTKSMIPDKNTDKSEGISDKEKIDLNQISQPSVSKINSTKNFSTSSKKLQRQKNASIEEVKEMNYKGLNNVTTVKNSETIDKPAPTPLDMKSDRATLYKSSTPITAVSTKSSTPTVTPGLPSKTLNSSSINPSISKSSVTLGTSTPVNAKLITETVKAKPAPTRIPEPSTKSAMKSPANNTAVVTTATSSKTSTTSTAKSTKVTCDRPAVKQDLRSVTALPSKITKSDQTTTSSVASALPLYIVSTSKTKIGSSSTPSISTVTKKTLEHKPVTEVVSTDGKSGKLLMSTSSSQSNQSSAKPKNTNVDLVKKDDRA